jgi:squalene-hopene/tetraprenyl-beta-curcumene cyclase
MDVASTFEEIHSGEKPRSGSALQPPKDLDTALRRSREYLLSLQKTEGYWVGELMVDSTLVSDTIAYHHWNG